MFERTSSFIVYMHRLGECVSGDDVITDEAAAAESVRSGCDVISDVIIREKTTQRASDSSQTATDRRRHAQNR